MMKQKIKDIKINEVIVVSLIRVSGYSAIVFVLMIFYFLLSEGLPTFVKVPISSLISTIWYPIEAYYGLLPLLGGSIIVTFGAALVAIPIGVLTAVYIAEVSASVDTGDFKTFNRGTCGPSICATWFFGDFNPGSIYAPGP